MDAVKHNEPYRVMLVCQSLRVGGAEKVVENLAYALREIGAVVTVVDLQGGKTQISDRLEERGVNLVVIGKKQGFRLSAIGKLRAEIRAFGPDVIHSHLPILHYVVPAARLSGVGNIVHTLHNTAAHETRSRLLRAFNGICYRRRLVRPVALSERNKRTIVEMYRLPEEAVCIARNSIDVSKYRTDRSYERTERLSIVHVGRFEEGKNHRLLVGVAAALRDKGLSFEMHLFGVGSLMGEIKAEVAENGLEPVFHFHGLTDDVPAALSSGDIFVLPSLYEGMPIAIIEAMASGLPIVASRVGGIPDMIEDGKTGLLRDANQEDFAEAILTLAGNPELRRRLGVSARRAAMRFGSIEMAQRYMDIYDHKAEDADHGRPS